MNSDPFVQNAVVEVVSFKSSEKSTTKKNPKNPVWLNMKFRSLKLIISVDGEMRQADVTNRLNMSRKGVSWQNILAVIPKTLKANVSPARVWICAESLNEWVANAKKLPKTTPV